LLRRYGRQHTTVSGRLESEKLLYPANQGDPFYIVKTDISQIVAFLGAILTKLKYVGGP
jgi:hypothetical protein